MKRFVDWWWHLGPSLFFALFKKDRLFNFLLCFLFLQYIKCHFVLFNVSTLGNKVLCKASGCTVGEITDPSCKPSCPFQRQGLFCWPWVWEERMHVWHVVAIFLLRFWSCLLAKLRSPRSVTRSLWKPSYSALRLHLAYSCFCSWDKLCATQTDRRTPFNITLERNCRGSLGKCHCPVWFLCFKLEGFFHGRDEHLQCAKRWRSDCVSVMSCAYLFLLLLRKKVTATSKDCLLFWQCPCLFSLEKKEFVEMGVTENG